MEIAFGVWWEPKDATITQSQLLGRKLGHKIQENEDKLESVKTVRN